MNEASSVSIHFITLWCQTSELHHRIIVMKRLMEVYPSTSITSGKWSLSVRQLSFILKKITINIANIITIFSLSIKDQPHNAYLSIVSG